MSSGGGAASPPRRRASARAARMCVCMSMCWCLPVRRVNACARACVRGMWVWFGLCACAGEWAGELAMVGALSRGRHQKRRGTHVGGRGAGGLIASPRIITPHRHCFPTGTGTRLDAALPLPRQGSAHPPACACCRHAKESCVSLCGGRVGGGALGARCSRQQCRQRACGEAVQCRGCAGRRGAATQPLLPLLARGVKAMPSRRVKSVAAHCCCRAGWWLWAFWVGALEAACTRPACTCRRRCIVCGCCCTITTPFR